MVHRCARVPSAPHPAATRPCPPLAAPYPPLSVGRGQQQRNEQGHRLQLQLGVCPEEGG